MLEGELVKPGFGLSKAKLKTLKERQISANKEAPVMPVSAFAEEGWKSNQYAYKPLKKLIVDTSMTPKKKDGANVKDNFDLYGSFNMKKALTSRKPSI